MRLLSLIPVLAVAACVESPMPVEVTASDRAAESHMLHEKDDVLSMPVVACNGEVVDLSGTAHFMIDVSFRQNGGIKFTSSTFYNLSGVGSVTGATYQGIESISDRAISNSTTAVSSSTVRVRLVAQGKVPNTMLDFSVRTVVVDGETKQERFDFRTSCK